MPNTSPFALAQPIASRARLQLTQHASIRVQQRGIPGWFLGLLLDHGRSRHDGHGAVIKSVDKSVRRQLKTVLTRAEYAAAERYFGVYAVVAADDAVVTAAHRTRRRHLH